MEFSPQPLVFFCEDISFLFVLLESSLDFAFVCRNRGLVAFYPFDQVVSLLAQLIIPYFVFWKSPRSISSNLQKLPPGAFKFCIIIFDQDFESRTFISPLFSKFVKFFELFLELLVNSGQIHNIGLIEGHFFLVFPFKRRNTSVFLVQLPSQILNFLGRFLMKLPIIALQFVVLLSQFFKVIFQSFYGFLVVWIALRNFTFVFGFHHELVLFELFDCWFIVRRYLVISCLKFTVLFIFVF